MTETELVKQVAAGAEAFSALVTLYRPALVTFCARRVGAEDAEEAAQDALFKAWQSFSQCKDLSKFKCWVWGIAKNECSKRVRAQRVTISLDEITEIAGDWGDELLSEREAYELLERVEQGIAKLPETQADCLLNRASGMGYSEIANATGANEATVRSNVRHARATLHKLVQNCD